MIRINYSMSIYNSEPNSLKITFLKKKCVYEGIIMMLYLCYEYPVISFYLLLQLSILPFQISLSIAIFFTAAHYNFN